MDFSPHPQQQEPKQWAGQHWEENLVFFSPVYSSQHGICKISTIHLNALQKHDALFYYYVIFYILDWFIISNISADLSAYSRHGGMKWSKFYPQGPGEQRNLGGTWVLLVVWHKSSGSRVPKGFIACKLTWMRTTSGTGWWVIFFLLLLKPLEKSGWSRMSRQNLIPISVNTHMLLFSA